MTELLDTLQRWFVSLPHCATLGFEFIGVEDGKPTLKVYDLVERLASAPDTQKAPAAEYVTRKEFDALAALVSEMKGKKRKEEKSDE